MSINTGDNERPFFRDNYFLATKIKKSETDSNVDAIFLGI